MESRYVLSRAALILGCSLFTGLSLIACGGDSPLGPGEEITELPRTLSAAEEFLIEAGNDFAFRLLGQVYGEDTTSNLFLSPLSASMALGMTLNGAAGETFDEMRSTLGFATLPLEQINQGYRDLIDLLRGLDPVVELGLGNSIWYRQGLEVRADFLGRTQDFFDAEVRALDFTDPASVGIINGWVREQTRDRITEIIEGPINPATVMFLINAIYFKGSWTYRFEHTKTVEVPFQGAGGTQGTVPLMEVTGSFPYTETETYQAVDLPYGGQAFAMTVLLPKEGETVGDLAASLDSRAWAGLVENLQEY